MSNSFSPESMRLVRHPDSAPAVREVLDFVRKAPGPVAGAMVAHRALTADPSLKTDWGGFGKFGTWVAQTRVTDVPALSAAQFRQVFLAMAARLREHPLNRTELSRLVRDNCVCAGQPVSRNAVKFVLQGLPYANFQLNDEATAAGRATAWTANVEELCRVALLEFDAAEKLAARRRASGGLLE